MKDARGMERTHSDLIGERERANLVVHLAAIFLYIYIGILGECMALLASGSDPTAQ